MLQIEDFQPLITTRIVIPYNDGYKMEKYSYLILIVFLVFFQVNRVISKLARHINIF